VRELTFLTLVSLLGAHASVWSRASFWRPGTTGAGRVPLKLSPLHLHNMEKMSKKVVFVLTTVFVLSR
jgi:hypothetical protein